MGIIDYTMNKRLHKQRILKDIEFCKSSIEYNVTLISMVQDNYNEVKNNYLRNIINATKDYIKELEIILKEVE